MLFPAKAHRPVDLLLLALFAFDLLALLWMVAKSCTTWKPWLKPYRLLVFTGESSFQGVLGGAKWTSSIHSISHHPGPKGSEPLISWADGSEPPLGTTFVICGPPGCFRTSHLHGRAQISSSLPFLWERFSALPCLVGGFMVVIGNHLTFLIIVV